MNYLEMPEVPVAVGGMHVGMGASSLFLAVGLVPTGIAADGSTLSMQSRGAPCHSNHL